MISRIDHISIAVKDHERVKNFFTGIFGAVPGASGKDDGMKFFWEIFTMGDLSRIELISSTGDGSFLDKFLSGRDGGFHHITLQVADINNARNILNKNRIPFFEGKDNGEAWKEIFIHPRDGFGALIQVAEFNPDDWISSSAKMSEGKKWEVERNADGCNIFFAHPGGGKVKINLDNDEIENLISDVRMAQ